MLICKEIYFFRGIVVRNEPIFWKRRTELIEGLPNEWVMSEDNRESRVLYVTVS